MKDLFTLVVLACFFIGTVNAQEKPAVKAERTKVQSKETLKKAESDPKKAEVTETQQRAVNVNKTDAKTVERVVHTDEHMKVRTTKNNAVKASENSAEPEVE